jgi:glycosyltransferase involved in cell wall biosynthesis
MNDASISIGICAHNEEETIGELIEKVLREDIPLKEIIVVVAGNDRTGEIVKRKTDNYDEIILIKEKERKGQIAAQNKILDKAKGEDIIFLDGDGIIEEGSLEELYSSYNRKNVVAGKEVPITDDSFTGKVIKSYGEAHHKMCDLKPRFSTHIGIAPSNLVDSFPRIILDDSYVEHRALEEDLNIEYEENAVKYHNTPNNPRFFFHQQKKNWAGRFQIAEKGYIQAKSNIAMIKVFLHETWNASIRKLPFLASLAVIELSAYITAKYLQFIGRFPVKWFRPED